MIGTSVTKKRNFIFVICPVAALFVAGLAAPAGAQLVSNAGFDTAPLYPGGINILVSSSAGPNYESGYTVGQWGAEDAGIVSTGNPGQSNIGFGSAASILPLSAPDMLDMVGPGTGSYTQAWQLVAVANFPLVDQAAIAHGIATATFDSWFNRPAFVSQNPATAGSANVQIEFFSQSDLQTYSQLNLVPSPPDYGASAFIPANTWTDLSVTSPIIPINTAYILLSVAFNNDSMTDTNGVDYDGYVDDVSGSVPEPASIGLLVATGIAALGVRRRRLI